MGKVNYPTGIVSNESRYAYLYRLQELLRLEHNRKGKAFREGEITETVWNEYKDNKFQPKSLLLSEEICKYRELLKKVSTKGAKITDIVI